MSLNSMTTIIGKCKFIVETKYFLTDFNVLKVKKMKLFKSTISEKKEKEKISILQNKDCQHQIHWV